MSIGEIFSIGIKVVSSVILFIVKHILPETIGLLSAIFVAYFTRWRFGNKDNISMLKQLLEELRNTYYSVDMFIQDDNKRLENSERTSTDPGYYIDPYPVAMWNVSIQTGRVLNMLSYKYSKKYYERVIETYRQILEANQTETIFYQMNFEKNAFLGGQEISINYQDYLRVVRKDLHKRVAEEIKELERIKEIKP